MTDERTNYPVDDAAAQNNDTPPPPPDDLPEQNAPPDLVEPIAGTHSNAPSHAANDSSATPEAAAPVSASAAPYEQRLERLGGEPAPVITPEEFARLQKAGQVHIDERGRIRTARRDDEDGGVSLKKRRAWY